MTTQQETVAIPTCEFVDETFAASIFGFDMDRLYYMQSWNSFPLPTKIGKLLVIRTDDIARWANNRLNIKRYAF